jgi:hypothetical protein
MTKARTRTANGAGTAHVVARDAVLATCRADVIASLHAAGSAALAKQSKTDLATLTYDKKLDFIRSATAGVVGVRGIDWQNRPTFQQIVNFITHRS